jgi:3-phosphoshikimate 1-carboxyvinyltransferase
LISKPYVEITLNLMQRFGIDVIRDGWQSFTVPAAVYRSPGEIEVEGDASSASYFLAAGALGHGPVRVEGVGRNSIQGDVRFAEALARMGVEIGFGPNWIESRLGCGSKLNAIDLDCNHIPDAAMTLAVLALFADGVTTLRNIASWRVKETDRIAAMATELRKVGATVEEGADFIRVTPPAKLVANARSTPTTTTAWRCASRWSAWAACRSGSTNPNASPRPSRITSPFSAAIAQPATCFN